MGSVQNVGEWHLWAPGAALGDLERGREVGIFGVSTVLHGEPSRHKFEGFATWGPVHLAPNGHWCLQPQQGSSKQTDRSLLFSTPSFTTLHPPPPPSEKISAPSQAAICLFGWPQNLLKCLSMDEATESRRTEPGRLLGEWKIIFWDILEFEALMMDVHARDGNGFVSIKTQSKRITLPNRLRNGCWAGSVLL